MSGSDPNKPGEAGKQDSDWADAELEFGGGRRAPVSSEEDGDEPAMPSISLDEPESSDPFSATTRVADEMPVPEVFSEPTRQIEEFGGDTRPIKADELQDKLTESWVDSPEDRLSLDPNQADEVFASRLVDQQPPTTGPQQPNALALAPLAPPIGQPTPLPARKEARTVDKLDAPTMERLELPADEDGTDRGGGIDLDSLDLPPAEEDVDLDDLNFDAFDPIDDGVEPPAPPSPRLEAPTAQRFDGSRSKPPAAQRPVRAGIALPGKGTPAFETPATADAESTALDDIFAEAFTNPSSADSRLDSGLFVGLDSLDGEDSGRALDSDLFARVDPQSAAEPVPPEPVPPEPQPEADDVHQRATQAHLTIEREPASPLGLDDPQPAPAEPLAPLGLEDLQPAPAETPLPGLDFADQPPQPASPLLDFPDEPPPAAAPADTPLPGVSFDEPLSDVGLEIDVEEPEPAPTPAREPASPAPTSGASPTGHLRELQISQTLDALSKPSPPAEPAAAPASPSPLGLIDDPRTDGGPLLGDLEPFDEPPASPGPSAHQTDDPREVPTAPSVPSVDAPLPAPPARTAPPQVADPDDVSDEAPTFNALPAAKRAANVGALEQTNAPAVAAVGRAPTIEPPAVQARADQATPAIPSEPLPPRFSARQGDAPHVGVSIDFGTTRSSVAVVVDGRVRILPLPNGRYDMLSCVGLRQDGAAVIGDRARELLAVDPRCVLPSPKRMLGRQYDDREIEAHIAQLAVPVLKGPNGQVTLNVRGRRYTVPQLCAPILYHLKTIAEKHLGQPVDSVVLTSPTAFDDAKHRALAETAALAGLRVQSFVDEPAAAALANRQDKAFKGMVGVYDYGGGTFDFSVIDVASLSMLTTAGDSWLGGDDFDEVIAGAAANAFWRQNGVEIRHQVVQWQRLLHAAEQAKRELSVKGEAVLHVKQAALTSRGPLDLQFRITRPQFAELARPLIERSMDTCETALDLCDIKVHELSAIYLSGGTSYIPAVQEAVARYFGKIPLIAVPPEQAVALGAACYAALPPAARPR